MCEIIQAGPYFYSYCFRVTYSFICKRDIGLHPEGELPSVIPVWISVCKLILFCFTVLCNFFYLFKKRGHFDVASIT
jgi:hypothetical protein